MRWMLGEVALLHAVPEDFFPLSLAQQGEQYGKRLTARGTYSVAVAHDPWTPIERPDRLPSADPDDDFDTASVDESTVSVASLGKREAESSAEGAGVRTKIKRGCCQRHQRKLIGQLALNSTWI